MTRAQRQWQPRLRCSKCGVPALGDMALIARDGETHYRRLSRSRAVSCGTWVDEAARAAVVPVSLVSRVPGEDDGY